MTLTPYCWYFDQAPKIDEALKGSNLEPYKKLLEAYKLRQAQQQAAMNALIDPELRGEFLSRYPLMPLDRIESTVQSETGLSGNPLFEEVYRRLVSSKDDSIYLSLTAEDFRLPANVSSGWERYPQSNGNVCFAAGTLVHTKKGLKPIESIKVGDWVLSRPEKGQGELAYKRVTRTFKSENKAVWVVILLPQSELERSERDDNFSDSKKVSQLLVTPNHRFGVKDLGWVRADYLKGNYPEDHAIQGAYRLSLVNEESAALWGADPLYETLEPNVAWRPPMFYSDEGTSVDLSRGGASAEFDYTLSRDFENDGVEWWEPGHEFRCTVYNLEVEDFHTYFVGTLGAWVHNDCFTEGGIARVYGQGEAKDIGEAGARGVILVKETVANPLAAEFQSTGEGALLHRDGQKVFYVWGYLYEGGVVRGGDTRALMPDNRTWSMTTIDQKYWYGFANLVSNCISYVNYLRVAPCGYRACARGKASPADCTRQ
jgi:hypothetical protein